MHKREKAQYFGIGKSNLLIGPFKLSTTRWLSRYCKLLKFRMVTSNYIKRN